MNKKKKAIEEAKEAARKYKIRKKRADKGKKKKRAKPKKFSKDRQRTRRFVSKHIERGRREPIAAWR